MRPDALSEKWPTLPLGSCLQVRGFTTGDYRSTLGDQGGSIAQNAGFETTGQADVRHADVSSM